MTMMIEKQFTKLLKPFVPTTPSLSRYKLGFIDEYAPAVNVGIVLFFSTNSHHNPMFVNRLEKSFEKTLTPFYPLAGRYVEENHTIDCNDQGAQFTYAKVNIKLDDILVYQADVKFIEEFIPSKFSAPHQLNDTLLATQVTMFEGGGVALGVSASHKIVDASTLCTFINEWAVMNREDSEAQVLIGPSFNSSVLFPARDLPPLLLEPMNDDILRNYTRKRLLFSENVISNMKANSTRGLSKVQLVSSIIWKAYIGVDRAIHNDPSESILIQAVNLRGKMASLIPKNSCGNLFGLCVTRSTTLETTKGFADHLSDSVKNTITNFSKAYHDNEEGQTIVLNSLSMTDIPESSNPILLTSWCNFSFYEADFGFGKPTWIAPGLIPAKKAAYLMDDVGGNGVEAYVFLETKDIPYFEEAVNDISKIYGGV